MRRALHGRGGFTLLEVVVALAILSLSLMAIFDLNGGAVANHAYTKRITVASLLARSKMIDLEQKLYEEGLPSHDDEESGDFSEEGWPSFKWRARIIAPKTTGVSTDKLLSALFGLPTDGSGGDSGMDALAAMFGGAAGGDAAAAAGGAGAGGLMAGAMGGIAQQQLTQFLEQITQTVREVHLTVSWRAGTEVETLDVVTHVVMLAPGADRNGGGAAGPGGGQAAAPGQQNNDPWVSSVDGSPISGEPVSRNGLMWDPGNPGVQVVRRSVFIRNQQGIMRNRPGGGGMFGGTKGWMK